MKWTKESFEKLKMLSNKVASKLKAEMKISLDKDDINKESIKHMISNKLDIVDFENKMNSKSNTSDTETNSKALEILHNFIKNIVVIMLESIQLEINWLMNSSENENSKLK